MDKERMQSLIIDYIDDRLNTLDRQLIEEEMMRNEEARKLYRELKQVITAMEESEPLEPSPNLKLKFERDLQIAMRKPAGRMIFFTPSFYRVAAAIALMVVSGAIGFWISRNNAQQEQLAEIRRQMDSTRQQLVDTKALMMAMIDNDQSASQRLKAVNVAMGLSQPDDEIVDVLFRTMEADPNTNVRLAALEALANFQEDSQVRQRLIRALTRQSDPMVQIRLIQLMVQMKEKAVVDDLQRIIEDGGTMKAVKDEAYSGILKLS